MEKQKLKDILVVGVGNILLGDEGIGVHVLKELEKKKLPDNVELLDLGVSSFSLLSHIEGKKKIIIIDAVKAEGAPGSVYRLSIEDIYREEERFFSLHEIGI
ncbi:hydrogenase maturation protease, partial [Candidatus Aerophobetes bacterium]|nr:hydrogenase maturation protease [Candidatus Aerophobetes bacterium]